MPWVQLRQAKRISVNGHPKDFQKGDWVEVGRQAAEQWEAAGACYISRVEKSKMLNLAGSFGVIVTHNAVAEVKDRFKDDFPGIALEAGDPQLLWEKNVIWDGHAPLRLPFIPIGLQLLDTWEVAIPLCDYSRLAASEGDEAERESTKAVIRDLRVPLYDPRLVFLRDCESTRRLIATWKQERGGGNERLALLRSIYRTKPLILALPVTWMDGHA